MGGKITSPPFPLSVDGEGARKRHRFRKRASLVLGALSAALGVSMSAPSVWSVPLLSHPGVGASEYPWLPIGIGLAAIRLSRGRRLGGWLGFIGVALALRPLWQLHSTSRRHEAAMRDGLGADFDAGIAATLRSSSARLAFVDSARKRRSQNGSVRVTPDILFHRIEEHELRADLYEPANAELLRPAVISVHGGSWRSGDKGAYYKAHHRWLAHQGYLVLDIQYRVGPDHLWPTHLEDVKTAIRWLRAHAPRYRVDPQRFALIGRSAGGHIALMAAFTPCDPAFPPHPGLPERDDVQAVIAIYPPTDLPLLQSTVVQPMDYWLGSRIEDRPDIYLNASPVYRVKRGAPPVLLAHGGADNIVVPEHSERLHKRLRELDVPSVLLRYPWSRHGFDFSLSGLGGQMLQYDMDRFLAWALRPRQPEGDTEL